MTHSSTSASRTQDQLKTLVAQAALRFVQPGQVIGVGTGSTVNKFIEALGTMPEPVAAAVSSSTASTERLRALGIPVLDANDVERLSVYVDGADEIDHGGHMIKGGGAALTREKIVAALADQFVCIADASKRVEFLGAFALPVEVVPMATAHVQRRFHALGGTATLRMHQGAPLVTDNGQHILDVSGLEIRDPMHMETTVTLWPGVVTVGIFAKQRAQVCLLGTTHGVETLCYPSAPG